jgi:endonuclease I
MHRPAPAVRPILRAILLALVTSGATARAQDYDPPATYYNSATGTGATLKQQLNDIIDGHTVRSYDAARSLLQVTDAHLNQSDTLILAYTREALDTSNIGSSIPGWNGSTWNREHTWPESRLGGSSGAARSDLFNLRPTRNQINSDRGNFNFGGIYGQTYGVKSDGGTVWYPGNADAGMIARQAFYMDTRYDGVSGEPNLQIVAGNPGDGGSSMGNLNRLIEWNYAAPPDEFERKRNQTIYGGSFQGNRNPFTDRPEWAWSVFVDNANDSSLTLQGGAISGGGASTLNADLGRRLVGSALPAAQTVTLNKAGVDGTYFSVTTAGAATSSITGRYNAFALGTTGTRSLNVGLAAGTSTATPGLRSGTVTIDNLDVTNGGGAGAGANDASDVITVSLSVLAHANASFADGSDLNSLTIDLGTAFMGATAPKVDFALFNLDAAAGFTAGLDLDSIVGSGATSALTTNLTTFSGASTLAGGLSRSFSAAMNTSTAGTYSATYTLGFSDENIVGATNLSNLTLTLMGVVAPALIANADFNGDGSIDGRDFLVWQSGQGLTGTAERLNGDANGDHAVDAADLAIWRTQFGTTPPAFASVPEPATAVAALAGIACIAISRRLSSFNSRYPSRNLSSSMGATSFAVFAYARLRSHASGLDHVGHFTSLADAVPTPQSDRREVTAEGDRDLHRMLELALPPDQRNAVEVAIRIRMREIHRRRGESVAEGQRGDCEFDDASRVHQMAEIRLNRADAQIIGRRAECGPDAARFHRIVLLSACAVGVDVGNILRRQA